ncbi:MAG: transposase [Planctomycetaceae bacterium]|nr:transposase [Planctomycetaceae bacterium]
MADALQHFDGRRYDMDSFVVMPNHVHLLVQFRPPTTLRGQTKSWLRFTALEINARLGRTGHFWQSEPFDHLVRSAEQFEYLRRYIEENPAKASLRAGEFIYWSSPQGGTRVSRVRREEGRSRSRGRACVRAFE